jgi:hypothetical protein
MGHDDRILPGAFGDEPKKLPLVYYDTTGKRHILGEATIEVKGEGLSVTGQVMDRVKIDELGLRDILGLSVGPNDVSIVEDPKKQS